MRASWRARARWWNDRAKLVQAVPLLALIFAGAATTHHETVIAAQ
jgi:hypothetical protein